MKIQNLLCLAAIVMLMTACTAEKPGKTFIIEGTAEGFADGDSLQVTDDDGIAIDTIIVNAGKFSYSGPADTVCLYSLNVIKDAFNNVSFFTEPGTTLITLSTEANHSTISGTTANEALQQLMTTINPLLERMHEIEVSVENDTLMTHEREWDLRQRYDQITNEVNNKILEASEANADNELGYMLLIRYIDESEYTELVQRIIEALPEEYRNRQPVKDLEEKLEASKVTNVGIKIPDFKLATPEGEELSIMSEISKNKVTILDFWASWCGPCRREMPFMKELYANYKDKGLGIVGISLDDDGDAWGQAISDLKLEWTHISDLKGWESSAAQLFNVTAIPFVLIVDNEGTILGKGLRGEPLGEFIASILSE